MLKQLQPQHLTIFKLKLELPTVEMRIVLVDDSMIIRADDNDVRRVVVLRTGEVVKVRIVSSQAASSEHTAVGMVIPSFSNNQSTFFCMIKFPSKSIYLCLFVSFTVLSFSALPKRSLCFHLRGLIEGFSILSTNYILVLYVLFLFPPCASRYPNSVSWRR